MPHPSLTPAQAERLYLLIEECAEVQQAVTKILRHGYESQHPEETTDRNNADDLQKEVADLKAVLRMFTYRDPVIFPAEFSPMVDDHKAAKLKYCHYQGEVQPNG